jgi:ribosomal-protein-alanine N-acetyltransferase
MRPEECEPTNNPEIRPGQKSDLPAIQQILAQSPEAASWSAVGLASIFEQNAKYFLVANYRKRIVGFVAGRVIADEAEILNLAVETAVRRKGFGKALVQSLLNVFASNSVRNVFLEVRESNRAAIAFYNQMGFVHSGTRPSYYSNPSEAALVLRFSARPASE